MKKSLNLIWFLIALLLPKYAYLQYNNNNNGLPCASNGLCQNQPQINPCSPNPCYNFGICNSNDGVTFKCTCSPNFSGLRCEKQSQSTNPCQNNNLCGGGNNQNQNQDPCSLNPCRNGGSCISNGQFANPPYGCACPKDYTGTKCEIYIAPPVPATTTTTPNPCLPNPCASGSTCLYNIQSTNKPFFMCICPPGMNGRLCNEPVKQNPCLNSPCQNGGTCVPIEQANSNPPYACVCPQTYVGLRCENPVQANPCANNLCGGGQNQNQCQNGGTYRNGYCVCPTQYTGTRCEILVQTNPCSNNNCGNQNNNNNNNPCANNPCQNGGTCRTNNAYGSQSYICQCPVQYTGTRCEIQVTTSNPCQNNLCGNNQNNQNNNVCLNNPCQNGGTCIPIKEQNVNPPFACVCPLAFTGLRCEIFLAGTTTRAPTQAPNPCATNPCQNGRCLPITQPSSVQYVCICDQNYSGTNCNNYNPPTTTQPPNPCLSAPCQNGGSCVTFNIQNVEPYACLCTRDYTGKRCETKLITCTCLNGGICRNDICVCPPQYTGTKCEILVQTNPCSNNNCGNQNNNNPCANNPCQNGGTCQANNAYGSQSYTCRCQFNFSGTRCEVYTPPTNPCQNNNLCGNGGQNQNQCQNGGTYRNGYCVCPVQYTGTKCEIQVQQNPCQNSWCGGKQSNDACSSSPCKNGATCRSTGFSFQCDCVVGFVGNQCETRQLIDLCASNSCYNGGTCETQRREQDQYTVVCFCPPEFTGSRCQISVPSPTTRQPNHPLPCQCLNNGICNSGLCECQSNYYGTRCEFQKNFVTTTLASIQKEVKCPVGLCINGRCANAPQGNGFYCVCNLGWTGTRCTIRNFCQTHSAKCQNGGVCLNEDNGYSCKCTNGYEGLACEIKKNDIQVVVNPCGGQNPCSSNTLTLSSNQCQNGGTSYTKNGVQMCQCQRGYIGLKCEQDICKQQLLTGSCNQSITRYYYNSQTKSCHIFQYGGCSGNENNFGSLESCNLNCQGH